MGESNEQVSISFTRSEYSTLEQKLEQMYNAEFDEIDNDVEEDMSIEDRHAERILNKTTLKNGHYQIGLPFKHNPSQLPYNLHTAEMRLKSLTSRMERNPISVGSTPVLWKNTKPKVQQEKLQTRS